MEIVKRPIPEKRDVIFVPVSPQPYSSLVPDRVHNKELGHFVNVTSEKTINPANDLDVFKVSDFSIDSLAAAGVENLDPVSLSPTAHDFFDKVPKLDEDE